MRTQDARNIAIRDYLERIGAKFARTQRGTHGLEYVYHSPNRQDIKPSLCVNQDRNIWSDVPQGVGGRLIELVCHLNGLPKGDVSGALAILDVIFPQLASSNLSTKHHYPQPKANASLSLFDESENPTGLKKKSASIEVIQVQDLFSYPLKNYLSDDRKINLSIAVHYVKEVRCRLLATGNTFYAIGFASGSTYAIRNKNFKGFAGTGADISIFDQQSTDILLFEGFMDFLSYLTAKKLTQPPCTAIVLNSSAMITRLITYVNSKAYINRIDYFRDRDELNHKTTGLDSLNKLRNELPNIAIVDKSEVYPQHNDLNDWLVDRFLKRGL